MSAPQANNLSALPLDELAGMRNDTFRALMSIELSAFCPIENFRAAEKMRDALDAITAEISARNAGRQQATIPVAA